MTRYGFPLSVALILSVSIARADDPKPIRLLLTPAKPTTPALRYQLLPDARVAQSGNAADVYRKVIELFAKKPIEFKKKELYYSWARLPLDRLPKAAMRKEFAEYDEVYEQLDKAAFCDHCDWGVLERVRKKGIGAVLPELQPMRECGLLLAVKARLEMADGNTQKALATLRTGFALARHTGESETLSNFLVGTDIANMEEEQLDQFVGRSDAPNLYYALTDLPVPLVSQRKALQGERVMFYGTFPGLAEISMNLDAGNLSENKLQGIMKVFDRVKRGLGFSDDRFYYPERILLAQNIQKKQAVAKKALIAAGRPRDKVEAMPPVQVAVLHSLLEYDARFDEILMWQGLPDWEMVDRLTRLNQPYRSDTPRMFCCQETRERLVREKDPNAPAIPLLSLLFPRIDRVVFARVRTDRKIALLRAIEPIRFYAADHDGQLPPSLAAIKEMPIPLDPVTGKGFEYQVNGEVAKLTAPTPAKETPHAGNTVIYELAIRK
jgi:hypothetical protein